MKIVLVMLMFLIVGCNSSQVAEKVPQKPVPIHVVEVTEKDIPHYIDSLGALKPSSFVEIRPQVSGVLAKQHFEEGDVVNPGQLLFAIDDRTYQIKLNEVLAQAKQNQSSYEAAEKKWERYSGLLEKNLVPRQEWEELNASLEGLHAMTLVDEARIAEAKLNLANCRITAPIGGKTGTVALHAGNLVHSGQSTALVLIAAVDELLVDFSLTEKELDQLLKYQKKDIPLEVYAHRNPETMSKGVITFLNYTYDRQSGLLNLRGRISNQDEKFLAGQSVKVRIPIDVEKGVLVVPQNALKINQNGPYVYRVTDQNVVEICPVTVGEEFPGMSCIISGLQKGDSIVTEGHLRLYPGASVEIIAETL